MFSRAMSLLGPNTISSNVENSSGAAECCLPLPLHISFNMSSLSFQEMWPSGSQATPGAGRSRRQDADSVVASRSCVCVDEGAREGRPGQGASGFLLVKFT